MQHITGLGAEAVTSTSTNNSGQQVAKIGFGEGISIWTNDPGQALSNLLDIPGLVAMAKANPSTAMGYLVVPLGLAMIAYTFLTRSKY